MLYPTSNTKPVLQAAINPKYKKLMEAGILRQDLSLSSGGTRIIAEMMVAQNIDALEQIAEEILSNKKSAKNEDVDMDIE